MGIGDYVDKAKDLVTGNKEKVKDGIDKAADLADEKTGGKFSGHVDQGADMAKDQVDKLESDE
ncbi:MAG: antitoxin [Actinomycetota bacterium]